MEVKIVNEIMPVLEINFEEMKAALSETLKDYKGIVVTEESLSECKATQKELAGVRTKLDAYRKDKKKELSAPITVFENQCKELIALVEQAETPIKTGIKVFDDAKRDAKRAKAVELIAEVIMETELNEKYGSRLDVLDKYCNLTAKDSEVKADLTTRAFALKVEQDREEELIDIIRSTVDTENNRLNSKMAFEDFGKLIERGLPTKDILASIKSRADAIYAAEHPAVVEPEIPNSEIPFAEPETVSDVQSKEIPQADESTYYAVYNVTGSIGDLKSVSAFLQTNRIAYKVEDQGEI